MDFAWYGKRILILGCGNWLWGDDGFGPAVVKGLENNGGVPEDVCLLDVGTSIREVLFDIILSEKRPKKIVVLDAMDCDREPGELFNLDIGSIPKTKLTDFSVHQVPTSSLLQDLRDLCDVDVNVIACQVSNRPSEINPGMSNPVEQAVKHAVETLKSEHLG